ncbi:MAG TPA: ribosome biogenesis GTPase Der [Pseudobdellovibrionaceae bacterium]|nr:ribosome biogenesis GTPase Der [Pseudobdellovibrionaceae bacterium]
MKQIKPLDDIAKVAIVGRPNVGKSTLFNVLTGTRKSVVKNQPGVTRDIIIEPVEIWGKSFDLIDTGGITDAVDVFSKLIKEQVGEFLYTVDLVLIVMDGKSGLMPHDRDLIKMVNQTGKPYVIILNKIDRVQDEQMSKTDFYEFGSDLIAAAFEQRRGIAEILEWITNRLPDAHQVIDKGMTLSFVGKPNVGKSSLCNRLLGSPRMLVSDIAGTTVDSVDTPFTFNGKQYTLIDTAGLRRSARREEDIEIISAFKSQESIRKSNMILLVIDCEQGPTDQDAKILESILDQHKAVLVVANKADIAKKDHPEFRKEFRAKIENVFHFFPDVRVVFTSAKTGVGIEDMLDEVEKLSEQIHFKISTSQLNDFFFEVIRQAPAPVYATKNVKFYYLTQTKQYPPAFIAFANHPDGVTPAYRRFLINKIKEKWNLYGLPIRIFCMKSRSKSGES